MRIMPGWGNSVLFEKTAGIGGGLGGGSGVGGGKKASGDAAGAGAGAGAGHTKNKNKTKAKAERLMGLEKFSRAVLVLVLGTLVVL
jgi:hypothetical protein